MAVLTLVAAASGSSGATTPWWAVPAGVVAGAAVTGIFVLIRGWQEGRQQKKRQLHELYLAELNALNNEQATMNADGRAAITALLGLLNSMVVDNSSRTYDPAKAFAAHAQVALTCSGIVTTKARDAMMRTLWIGQLVRRNQDVPQADFRAAVDAIQNANNQVRRELGKDELRPYEWPD